MLQRNTTFAVIFLDNYVNWNVIQLCHCVDTCHNASPWAEARRITAALTQLGLYREVLSQAPHSRHPRNQVSAMATIPLSNICKFGLWLKAEGGMVTTKLRVQSHCGLAHLPAYQPPVFRGKLHACLILRAQTRLKCAHTVPRLVT